MMHPRLNWARSAKIPFVGGILLLSIALYSYQLRAGGREPGDGWGDGRAASETIRVFFSPGDGCAAAIVREIEAADKRIGVQAYFFTSRDISEALMAAAGRGVQVTLILDESQRKIKYCPWKKMQKAGVRVLFDKEHKTANNKIVLIDDHTVITGSYNFTKSAEKDNAENLLIIKGEEQVFDKFRRNFKKHMDHAK